MPLQKQIDPLPDGIQASMQQGERAGAMEESRATHSAAPDDRPACPIDSTAESAESRPLPQSSRSDEPAMPAATLTGSFDIAVGPEAPLAPAKPPRGAGQALAAMLALPDMSELSPVSDLPAIADALDGFPGGSYPQLPESLTLRTACRAVRQLVGDVVGLLSDRMLMRRDRRRLNCHSRQIAIYVCHVVLQVQQRDIADAFGVDRTTVSHACHVVEDRRDDSAFDEFVCVIERMVGAVFGISQAGSR